MSSLRRKSDKEREIVVRRRGKKNREGIGHSGAWKVAFADFTLAMMALFMVLWIINPSKSSAPITADDPVSNPIMEGMVGTNMFDNISELPVDLDGSVREIQPPPPDEDVKQFNTREELEQLAELIEVLSGEVDAISNIEVQVVPQGLRILIKDDQKRFMFERGSARLHPHFRRLLGGLSSVLSKVENRLIISGHTDATQYRKTATYNNWNLSGDRALLARNVLVGAGLPAVQVLQVSAFSDVMPLNIEDPLDGANRRIELLLLTEKAERLYRDLFGDSYPQLHYGSDGKMRMPEKSAPPPAELRLEDDAEFDPIDIDREFERG
jgi:chemotaxis protein MotB